MSTKTAILVFSNSAQKESELKSFHKAWGRSGDERMATHLIAHTHELVDSLEMPSLWVQEDMQEGDSFGERLANAMEWGFSQGFERIIAIGNDCPSLSKQDILQTDRLLSDTSSVLGPCKDGGVYLIGISKKNYSRSSFLDIDWQGRSVCSQLNQWFDAYLLDVKADIDNNSDLLFFLKEKPQHLLAQLIFLWLADFKKAFEDYTLANAGDIHLHCTSLRAPPTSIAF